MAHSDDESTVFQDLIRPHLSDLYRLAYRFTGAVADAEDLVQEVLIKVYERRSELTSIGALRPWLSRVLYNQFIDNVRRYSRQRLQSVPLDPQGADAISNEALQSQEPDPEDAAEHAFNINELGRALESLSLEHRAVLLMHDSQGYKLEEIQVITGTPLGTLKSRLHRARARLRDLLSSGGTF